MARASLTGFRRGELGYALLPMTRATRFSLRIASTVMSRVWAGALAAARATTRPPSQTPLTFITFGSPPRDYPGS